MLAACAQQDAKFPASALPWHPGQQLSLVTIPGETFLASGLAHAGMSHRVQDTGVTGGSANRGVSRGSAHPGITRGSSHWLCCAAGLRASPWEPVCSQRRC